MEKLSINNLCKKLTTKKVSNKWKLILQFYLEGFIPILAVFNLSFTEFDDEIST